PCDFALNGRWAAYDAGEIQLDGLPTGNTIAPSGSSTWHPFSISGTNCTTNAALSFLVHPAADSFTSALRVQVTNATCQCCTSCIPPVFLPQPDDETGYHGSGISVTFRVLAAGPPPLSYQWYYQLQFVRPGQDPFAPLSGATDSSLTRGAPS